MSSHEGTAQEYWENAIQDFFKLGMLTAKVPKAGLRYDMAKAIASEVDAHLSSDGNDYIFRRNMGDKLHDG